MNSAQERIYADYRKVQVQIGKLYNTTTPMSVIERLSYDLEIALHNATEGRSVMKAEDLSRLMDFDCPIVVHSDGSVTQAGNGIYAPSLLDGELDSSQWELLDGYSGQDRYSGPVMHNSEYIGGRMAEDILAEPGTYVVIAAYYSPEDEEDELIGEGWAVAKLVTQ